jgi:hypothetical protein
VSAEAGASGGTIVHTQGDRGFITMDWRSPIRLAYRGGAITVEEAGRRAISAWQ